MRWAVVVWLLFVSAAWAVEPGERLDDPEHEARARELSKGLRCLVCRNESIDESNAELARDLRLLVRERIAAGDSDDEVIEFLVARFGEYVLLTPDARGANLFLWAAGPVLLIIAAGGATLYLRRRSTPRGDDVLSTEEEARLAELTGKETPATDGS